MSQPTPSQPPYGPGQRAEAPAKRRLGPIIGGAVALVVVIVATVLGTLAATGSSKPSTVAAPVATTSSAPATITVKGMLVLDSGDFTWNPGEGCWGIRGYEDLTADAGVTVTDAAGAVVALGRIDSTIPITSDDDITIAERCELHFTAADVPSGKGFYGVEVTHRGAVKFTEADLTAGPVELTLD